MTEQGSIKVAQEEHTSRDAQEPEESSPESGEAPRALPNFDATALIGETLAGRYNIEREIGKGGMGVVYLASQSTLNRKVVIKVLAQGLSENDEAIQRFEREALGLSQLQHPNTVTIYDFGQESDLAYIVMEYVKGHTLSHMMGQRKGGMSFEEFGPVSAQILDALAEAHERGIIHRDIKPSNIMLTSRHGHENFVKVLDFGLAKLIDDAAEVTKKQNLVGSVAYLAPEQILGLAFDQRADVYALGVLFYYLLTGERPFRGDDDIAVLYQHIHKAPVPLNEMLPQGHDIPQSVLEHVEACLSKDPEDRPADASALLMLMQHGAGAGVRKPWVSGEFASVSSQSVSMRELTPISGQLPGLQQSSTPGLVSHGEYTPSGSYPSLASVDASQLSYAPQPERKLNRLALFVGVAALLALLLAAGALFMAMDNKAPQPALQRAQLEQALDQAEALVDDQKWGQVENMLGTLQSKTLAHPELMSRAASLSERAAIGKLLQQAHLAQEKGAVQDAREHYSAILVRSPGHAVATERLAALAPAPTAQQDPAAPGSLTIEAPVLATVSIDGEPMGETPFIHELAPATYELVVSAKDHRPWSKTITVTGGEAVMLEAALEKLPRKAAATSKSTKPTQKQPAITPTPPPVQEKTSARDFLIPLEKTPKKKPSPGLLP